MSGWPLRLPAPEMSMSANERVFIGLGSNVGDRELFIRRAIRLLKETRGIQIVRCASLYETEPVGMEAQPWFLNTVVEIRTELEPRELFWCLKEIEQRLGRKPRGRWGPREIDLDLLLYGNRVLSEPELEIPHPQVHQRRFMLIPLYEIAPDFLHPIFRRTISELLQRLKDDKEVRLLRSLK